MNYSEANTYFLQPDDLDSNGKYVPDGFFRDMNMFNCSINWHDYQTFLDTGDRTLPEIVDLAVGGSPATCIAVAPLTMCKCQGINKGDISNLYVPPICVDPDGVCGRKICFQGGAYPISEHHGFGDFFKGSMTVIGIFFLKNWTLYLVYSLAVAKSGLYAMIAWVYYFLLVIFGSFCLLNLTVATVSDIYSKLKKSSELKRKAQNEEQAKKDALEAEREAMRANAKAAAKKDDEDADEEPRTPLRFDSKFELSIASSRLFPYFTFNLYVGTAYKLWILGPLCCMPFLHNIYFKCWYEKYFVLRCCTLNYFFVGWILDGLTMSDLNQTASDNDKQRDIDYAGRVDQEYERIDVMLRRVQLNDEDDPLEWNLKIGQALSYPDLYGTWNPLFTTRKYLESEKARMYVVLHGEESKDENPEVKSTGELSDEDEDDDDDNPADQDDGVKVKEGEGQSWFAWFADFVVIANAASMAMQGFGQNLSPIISAVGIFATIFFVLESVVKSIAYGGFNYYLSEGSNKFDLSLVIIPTFGELVCQITKALFGREDYIYLMLALRALRVLRILKLVKHLTGLKRLAASAFKSPGGVLYAFLVTIIFIVMYALFGNELFKKSALFAANRNDFSVMFEALVAMIETLFGDRYYDNIEIGYVETSFVGMFYFIIFFYICNFLVLRIFIAIILENFEFSEEKKIALQIQLFQKLQILKNDLINGR
jgi:hypothetical protein